MLFEHFNTTNQTQPWFLGHDNFIIDLKSPGCGIVQTKNYEDRCDFVKQTAACRKLVRIFDYTYYFYCVIDARTALQQFLGICSLFLFCFFLFTFVGTCTDKFFCPALKMITKVLGLSENLAGVTLLSFGNNIPDLLSNLVGVEGNVNTAYSDMMGSGLFITGFISGTIIFLKPLRVDPRPFTRDMCFHIIALLYIDYAIKSDRRITLWESITMITIYVVYIILCVLDHIILIQTLNNLTKRIQKAGKMTVEESRRLRELQDEAGIDIVITPRFGFSLDVSKKTVYVTHARNENLFKQLFTSLMPFDIEGWQTGGYVDKFFILLQVPINALLFTLVPAADYNLEVHGWSKLLNCVQLIISPSLLALYKARNVVVFEYPLHIFILFITGPLGVITFFITRTDTAPSFHIIFAVFAIAGSIVFVNTVSREALHIIDVLGMVTYSSTSFLGCTILAWGGCVGDFVVSISMAHQGYQRMGLASCIAGPLFLITICLGAIYLYKTARSPTHSYEVTQGSMGETCTVFQLCNLFGMILSGCFTDFNLRKSIGLFLISIYVLFCFYCLLGEYQFIHSFGTDHTEDYGIAFL